MPVRKAKLRPMVAEAAKPKIGRPKKFEGEPFRLQILLPSSLYRAAEEVRHNRRHLNLPDTIRELLSEAIEAEGVRVSTIK